MDARLALAQAGNVGQERLNEFLSEADRIQGRLWSMAVTNARKDMNSDVAAVYIESLNEMFEVHALRLTFALQVRIPIVIWIVLYGLTILGMMVMGYHTGIAGSRRSMVTLILAIAFAVVIAMIASIDRPGGFIKVTQHPLIDLQAFINAREGIPKDTTQE